uniref:uncharacterized protein LOC120335162 n=1 Tax=Styela clava TaxID=7725 RepID=UPI001939E226|nr:uncharacterized protein LOC120335162 [Styela clava]
MPLSWKSSSLQQKLLLPTSNTSCRQNSPTISIIRNSKMKTLLFLFFLFLATFRSATARCSSYDCKEKSVEIIEPREEDANVIEVPKFEENVQSIPQFPLDDDAFIQHPRQKFILKPKLKNNLDDRVILAIPEFGIEDFDYNFK